MAIFREWVYESHASEDVFRAELRMRLEEAGYRLRPARVYDFAVTTGGARGFVAVSYHARGIRLEAKAKGLGPRSLLDGILQAGREAQVALWQRQGSPDYRMGETGVGERSTTAGPG
ncbi:MAG: hypothetical protein ACYDDF_10255 [Thermoplasmatota archaeon]